MRFGDWKDNLFGLLTGLQPRRLSVPYIGVFFMKILPLIAGIDCDNHRSIFAVLLRNFYFQVLQGLCVR